MATNSCEWLERAEWLFQQFDSEATSLAAGRFLPFQRCLTRRILMV